MNDRCPCGCTLIWDADDARPHCPHCDLPPLKQPEALLAVLDDGEDFLPLGRVRG